MLATLPAHAVVGLALLLAAAPIAGDVATVAPWGWTALDDQRAGAALMWVAGEIVALGLLAVVLLQWRRIELRAARRADLRLERDGGAAPPQGDIG